MQNMAEKIEGGDFIFNYLDKLYYGCHKTTLNREKWYIDSPHWLKQKTNINP